MILRPLTPAARPQSFTGKVGLHAPLGRKAALRIASYYDRISGYIDAVQRISAPTSTSTTASGAGCARP